MAQCIEVCMFGTSCFYHLQNIEVGFIDCWDELKVSSEIRRVKKGIELKSYEPEEKLLVCGLSIALR